jgi:hypothetical protein
MSESSSSWFSNFGVLSNISSSILQATSKVSNAVQNVIHPQQSNEEQNAGINKNLTSIFTDLSSTVVKGAQHLKQVVEEKSFLGHFTKEQDKFLTEKRTQLIREEIAVPPWVGYQEEEEMKKQILALSQEKRNFLRDPPPGANYHFDMTAMYPVALATLEVDENLKQMRFELVPKQVKEEVFWQNYFYRVSLIKQSAQLTALTNENTNTQSTVEPRLENHASSIPIRQPSESLDNMLDINQEFVSEDYDTSAVNMEEIRREIEQLSTAKKIPEELDESEWDKALADELENVSTDDLENISAEDLEAQINQILTGNNK